MNRKIDFYWSGEYLDSTRQAKSCKEAKDLYLYWMSRQSPSLFAKRILKNPQYLTTKYCKLERKQK